MNVSFTGAVRAAAREFPKSGFTSRELAAVVGIASNRERIAMHSTIKDMLASGELKRIAPSTYEYVGKPAPNQKQHVMWRYLRSGRSFGGVTIEELREVSGAEESYVREWLQLLVRRGVVREFKNKGKWQLLVDLIEMPLNDEKAEKLRRVRERKKQSIIQALERAEAAIARAVEFMKAE